MYHLIQKSWRYTCIIIVNIWKIRLQIVFKMMVKSFNVCFIASKGLPSEPFATLYLQILRFPLRFESLKYTNNMLNMLSDQGSHYRGALSKIIKLYQSLVSLSNLGESEFSFNTWFIGYNILRFSRILLNNRKIWCAKRFFFRFSQNPGDSTT